jgi:hypothetical protein
MKLTITDDVEDVEGIDVADLSDVASSDEDI